MLHSFEHFLQEKYKNEKTIKGYLRDVKTFLDFLEKEAIKVSQIKELHIKKYNLKLNDRGISNHTIARKNSSLRLFLKFLRKEGIMIENPMEEIKQPRLEKRDVSLTDEDIERLEKIITSKRDLLLFYLTYLDKLKTHEIIALKKENYKHEQGILYIGKRAILVHEKTKKELEQLTIEETMHVVTNQHNKPLTESGIYYIFKNYFKEIGKEELRPIDLYKK